MNTLLIDKTISGLARAKGEFRAIAAEAGVGYSWLSKFSRSVYPDPSTHRVERVYRVLVARGLAEPVIDFRNPEALQDCA